MSTSIDFQPYLQSVVTNAGDNQDFYTPIQVRKVSSKLTEQIEALAGLREYAPKHVLLLGKPGSGKSTLLQRLLWEEAQQALGALKRDKFHVPVLIKLRDCGEGSVLDWLKSVLSNLELSEIDVKKLLQEQRLLLLFDGLNELPSQKGWNVLDKFRREYPNTPMIFTARELGAGRDLGIKNKLEIMPLTEIEMRQFVERLLPGGADELLRQMDDCLKELAETPLLLKMICDVFKPNEPIPQNRGDLFRDFSKLYDDEHKPKYAFEEIAFSGFFDFRNDILRLLAATMIRGSEKFTDSFFQIEKHQVAALIENFLRERDEKEVGTKARRWCDDLIEHHLLQVGGNSNKIEFQHQLFQEYYAAEWLRCQLPNLSNTELQQNYLNYLKWTESITLMMSLIDNGEQAERIVRQALEIDQQLGARLAGAARPEFQDRTVGLVLSLSIPQIVKLQLLHITGSKCRSVIREVLKALDSQDTSVRVHGIIASENLASEASIFKKLVEALKQDSNPDIRRNAAYALGRGRDLAVPDLFNALMKDKSCDVKQAAAFALGEIVSKAAIARLSQALEASSSEVCKYAVLGLSQINSDQVIPELIKALKHQDPEIRKEAALTLQFKNNASIVPELLEALEDYDSQVRFYAFCALSNLNSEAMIPGLLGLLQHSNTSVCDLAISLLERVMKKLKIDDLLKLLKHPNSKIRCSTIRTLAEVFSEASTDSLLEAIEDSDSNVRETASVWLGKIGNEEVVAKLVKKLSYGSLDIQKTVIKTLEYSAMFGVDSALDALLLALNHQSPQIQLEAFSVLGSVSLTVPIQSQSVIQGLIDALEHPNPDIRLAIPYYLMEGINPELVSEPARNQIIQLLRNQSPETRRASAAASGKLKIRSGIPELVKLTKDETPEVCLIAACALVEFGNEASEVATPILLQSLKEQNLSPDLSWIAVDALNKLDSEVAVSEMLKLLNHEDIHYRYGFFVLKELPSRKLIPALIKILDDLQPNDAPLRQQAIKLLGELGGEEAFQAICKSLQDSLSVAELVIAGTLNSSDPLSQKMLVADDAIEALGRIGTEAAIQEMIEALGKRFSPSEKIVEVLSKLNSDAATQGLVAALDNPLVQEKAMEALGQQGRDAIVQALLMLTASSSLLMSHDDAIEILMEPLRLQSSGSTTLGLLEILEDSGSILLWDKAAELLSQPDVETVVPTLLQWLKDEHTTSSEIAQILSQLCEPQQLPEFWQLHLECPENHFDTLIEGIQSRCKFYEYEVFQQAQSAPPPLQSADTRTIIAHNYFEQGSHTHMNGE